MCVYGGGRDKVGVRKNDILLLYQEGFNYGLDKLSRWSEIRRIEDTFIQQIKFNKCVSSSCDNRYRL